MPDLPPFVQAVAAHIYQVQLPLPFALRIVNCYLLRGHNGWTIVDTGLNTAQGRETWETALAALQIAPDDITQIVLTHVHPDHYGQAAYRHRRPRCEGQQQSHRLFSHGGRGCYWHVPFRP
jgi:glyoxylase-like metal-dependent hydrolase (beta-lactamase superfamily II)